MKTIAAVIIVTASAVAIAQQPSSLETLRVANNVYAIFGAGGNVTVQTGSDGVLWNRQ